MIGEKLGNYTIIENVGTGSMGTVYRAVDPEGHAVAAKIVRSQHLYSMEKRERFLRCLLTASEIRHKGVCPILDIGDDNDDFFVITPFIEARTLAQYREHKSVPWTEALGIASEILSALAAIHDAGAAHRGLKPSNIWIMGEDAKSVLLTDSCISRFTEISKRSRSRSRGLGIDFADTLIPLDALAYMSPEQVRGEPVDYRSDIFSFGVILQEMLTGRHPFEARSSLSQISAILEGDPAPVSSLHDPFGCELERLLRKTLAKNPEERYQSVHPLVEDLKTILQIPPRKTIPEARPSPKRLFSFFRRK